MKFKKGEMSTQQIVLLIVLITSFVVILFFLFRINLGSESQNQICQNSVMLRASSLFSSSTPLNCYRDYICITKDGSCDELIKPEKVKVDSLNETYGALANEMADCWWMFGEGKVDYIGGKAFHDNYCSICSQIFFDDSLKEIEKGTDEEIKDIQEGKISKERLYYYLANNDLSPTKEVSYAEYLFGTNDIESLKKGTLEDGTEVIGTFGNIDVGKQYFNVMGITSKVSKGWYIVGGTALVVGTVFTGGALAVVLVGGGAAAIATGGVAGLIEPEIGAIVVEGDGIENDFMAPTIQEVKSDKFNALNCEDILTQT